MTSASAIAIKNNSRVESTKYVVVLIFFTTDGKFVTKPIIISAFQLLENNSAPSSTYVWNSPLEAVTNPNTTKPIPSESAVSISRLKLCNKVSLLFFVIFKHFNQASLYINCFSFDLSATTRPCMDCIYNMSSSQSTIIGRRDGIIFCAVITISGSLLNGMEAHSPPQIGLAFAKQQLISRSFVGDTLQKVGWIISEQRHSNSTTLTTEHN